MLTPPSLTMDPDERDALLAEPRTAVLAVTAPNGRPVLTPVWYRHQPDGDLVVVSARQSRKVRLIEEGGAVSVLVQSEAPPRYVNVDVEVEVAEADLATRRSIAARYVPDGMLEDYLAMTTGADSVLLCLHPIRWRTSDLTKVGQVEPTCDLGS